MIKKKGKIYASTSVLWLLFIPLAAISKVAAVEAFECSPDDDLDRIDDDMDH